MAHYESEVIYTFADRLYSRANSTIAIYVLIGALVGASSAYAIAGATINGGIITAIGGLLFAVLGYMLGSERAFQLKLQAQTALCQVKIEENTRKQSVVASTTTRPASRAGV